jgi:hypothetical protein
VIAEKTKLELLRERVGTVAAASEMKTALGTEWRPRLQRSKDYLEKHSWDWDDLRAFFAKPYHEIDMTVPEVGVVKLRIKLSLMWSMGKNHVSDLHFSNPEPWIRTRRGRADRDFDRMINDVGRAMHDNADSEEATRECLTVGLYQGGGIEAWTFEQDGEWEDAPILDDYGDQVVDDDGQPMFQTEETEDGLQTVQQFRASNQRVRCTAVPLSRVWLDPNGRKWDFCDSKYLGWLYDISLKDAVESPKFYAEGKKLLVNAVTDSYSKQGKLSDEMRDRGQETDPAHITVTICEVWDRVNLRLVHIPVIAGEIAQFDIGTGEWPRGLREMKRFPFRLVAEDWNPPNKADDEGIYPIPLFRHARALVEDIIRLYELFFAAASKVVDKWVTYEGALKAGSGDFSGIMSTDSDQLVTLDPVSVRQTFGGGGLQGQLPNPADVIQRLDRGGEKIAQAIGFANMIQGAKNELYEIFGQGPADRGGVAEGTTATEIAQMSAERDKRTKDSREQIAKAFDDGTEIAFALTREYQTLPIPYQKTSSAYSDERWAEFEVEMLYGLDLVFSHVTDSSKPKTRAVERIERKDFVANILPFIQSKRQVQKLARWAAEAYDVNGLELEDLFFDEAPEIAKQLLALQVAVQDDPALASNPEIAARMTELVTALIEAVLSDADKEEVANGEAMGGGGASRGAGKKSMTSGQMAAAGAAAGMTNAGRG